MKFRNYVLLSSNSKFALFSSKIPKSVKISSLISFEQNLAQFNIISKQGTDTILGLGTITFGVGFWKTHSSNAVYRIIIFSFYSFFWEGEITGVGVTQKLSASDGSLLVLDFFSLLF